MPKCPDANGPLLPCLFYDRWVADQVCFQGAESLFDFPDGVIDVPDDHLICYFEAGSQEIHPILGFSGLVKCFLFLPMKRCCNPPGFIRANLNSVIMVYGWVFFLRPADTLPYLAGFLNPAFSRYSLLYPCKISFKPLFKLGGHRLLFDRLGITFYL